MISFVIPAHDEARLIGRTLESVRTAAGATVEPYEIVVADDGSTDGTSTIARQHGARVVCVRHRQIAATRNSGARAARGDRLVFVDADTVVDAAVVRGAMAAMRDGAVGGGALVRFDGTLPAWARVVHPLLSLTMLGAGLAAGCFVFCTRVAFESVGGFDERMFGAEEVAISRALRRQGRFVVLRESVLTSGRKFRAYSGREILGIVGGLLSRGRDAVTSRDALDAWYGPRREDPENERPTPRTRPGRSTRTGPPAWSSLRTRGSSSESRPAGEGASRP